MMEKTKSFPKKSIGDNNNDNIENHRIRRVMHREGALNMAVVGGVHPNG